MGFVERVSIVEDELGVKFEEKYIIDEYEKVFVKS